MKIQIKTRKKKVLDLDCGDYFVWCGKIWEVTKSKRTFLHKHKFVIAQSMRYNSLSSTSYYEYQKFYEGGKNGDKIVDLIVVGLKEGKK